MNRKNIAEELVGVAKELNAGKKKMNARGVQDIRRNLQKAIFLVQDIEKQIKKEGFSDSMYRKALSDAEDSLTDVKVWMDKEK